MNFRRFSRQVVTALTLLTPMAAIAADGFPQRPITLVVPFAPGGGNDSLARIVAAKAGEVLGGVIVVENRPGAGGGIAAQAVAKARPDGYTLLQGNIAHAINMSLYAKPGYDIVKDFEPVTMIATSPLLFCVPPRLGVKTMKEFVELAKSKPGSLNYGSSGMGGASHLAVELLKAKTGIELQHIPYQGSGPSVTDLLAGRLDLALPAISSAPPLMQAGKIVCLSSTSSVRSKSLPDMPATAEALGIDEYEALPWYGILAPKGTPPAIVSALAEAVKKAVEDPKVRDALTKQGFDVQVDTPDNFRTYITAEVDKWSQVVKESGARAE